MLFRVGRVIASASVVTAALVTSAPAQTGPMRASFATIGGQTSTPYGWIDFCRRHAADCGGAGAVALDLDLSHPQAWRTLERVNTQVNTRIEAVTDLEHHGVEEYWSYPDDGRGDCEDFVLLKRRLLIAAGVPRQALLITVVRDERDDGHAVLTVKTSAGEFVLDNKRAAILPWTQTGYRFVKRQSQTDPNVWLEVGPPEPAPLVTAAPSRRITR
ncbi:MAG: transglutaminase-like cysteine peptidase [Methylobacteriaceae bacterium]|nr:transglutaminase-like cysteine peptidase [Methylobacteriaceae bacterium]